MLDSTGKNILRVEDAGCCDSGHSNTYDKKRYVNEEDNLGKIEESPPPPRRSGRNRKTLVRATDTVMVAVEYLVTYVEATRGTKKNELKLALKG